MKQVALGLIIGAALFTPLASGHETSGGADYTTGGQALLNDHDCHEDEYKFIAAGGNKVRCVPMDGGFPRLAPHE